MNAEVKIVRTITAKTQRQINRVHKWLELKSDFAGGFGKLLIQQCIEYKKLIL